MAKKQGNENNLKPVRTNEEARERGRKGDLASAESRRNKRTMRETAKMLMQMEVVGERNQQNLENFGLNDTPFLAGRSRHPIDGCYGIKREARVSIASSNILLAVMILFYIINKYFCGFLTKTVKEGKFDVLSDIGMIIIALVLVVGCNYLMCTINDGEGRFKHIYSSLIYSFAPFLVFTPFIFLLSHGVSNNEIFFVQFGRFCMWVWIGVLVFISIREINNYTVKETVKIILLTLFTILIVCLLIFIIYVLWSQVFDFLQSIFGEAVYRIGS